MTDESQDRPPRERECSHRRQAARGRAYSGVQFVSALYRLRGDAAVRLARKVEPFFWADAPRVTVWLCEDCAREAGLEESLEALEGTKVTEVLHEEEGLERQVVDFKSEAVQ